MFILTCGRRFLIIRGGIYSFLYFLYNFKLFWSALAPGNVMKSELRIWSTWYWGDWRRLWASESGWVEFDIWFVRLIFSWFIISFECCLVELTCFSWIFSKWYSNLEASFSENWPLYSSALAYNYEITFTFWFVSAVGRLKTVICDSPAFWFWSWRVVRIESIGEITLVESFEILWRIFIF